MAGELNIGPVHLKWLGHAGFRFESQGKIVYVDPYILDGVAPPADYVLITHEHHDHCSPQNIQRLMKPNTIVIAKLLEVGKGYKNHDIKVIAVPAYNIGKPYHTPRTGIGYVIDFFGVKIYHSGDTDKIPEMAEIGIPMHWGAGIIGTRQDAEQFQQLVGDMCQVAIL